MFKPFSKIYLSISDCESAKDIRRALTYVQNNISDSIDQMAAKTQNDSNILYNISLVSGKPNIINHGLSRPLTGYNVIGKSASSDIWDGQATNNNKRQTLILFASADVTIALEVF
jgi:hypothetical protein